MRSTPATHAGVNEYTATFIARALFCSPPNVGASALMMKPTRTTPMIAPMKVHTASASPANSDIR